MNRRTSIGILRRTVAVIGRSDVLPALAAFGVYLLTLAPGVTGYDSAELITGAYTLGIVHPTGYPLYLLLGKLFTLVPVGSIAYRVNLMSALFGAVTVWLVARLAFRLTGRRWVAWAGAGLLAFSYSYWRLSVVAEVYTLHAFFLALELALLEQWLSTKQEGWVLGLSLAYGLSLANHVSGVLFAPALAFGVLVRVPLKRWAWLAIKAIPLLLPGLLLYAYFPLRSAADPALDYVRSYYDVDLTTLSGVWWMMSGAAYRFFAFGYDLPGYIHELGSFAGQLLRSFTAVGVLLGLGGAWSLIKRRHPLAVVTLAAFMPTVAFFAAYAVGDKGTMYLPAYVLWSLWVVEGGGVLVGMLSKLRRLSAGEQGALRGVLQAVLVGIVVVSCAANWGWVDMSQEDEPEIFARQALSAVDPGALIVGQWSTAVILEYFQVVEGMRPDVEIFNRSRYEIAQYYELWSLTVPHDETMTEVLARENLILRHAARIRPIYILEYDSRLASQYEYQPVGNLFRLVPKPGSRT